jgi:hypothetical protein
MKRPMALPILAAAVFMAVDRWTAVPWPGLVQGDPSDKVVEAANVCLAGMRRRRLFPVTHFHRTSLTGSEQFVARRTLRKPVPDDFGTAAIEDPLPVRPRDGGLAFQDDPHVLVDLHFIDRPVRPARCAFSRVHG